MGEKLNVILPRIINGKVPEPLLPSGSSVSISDKLYNNLQNIQDGENDGLYSAQEIITFNHIPTQSEIDALPDGSLISYEDNSGTTNVIVTDVRYDNNSITTNGIAVIPYVSVDGVTIQGKGTLLDPLVSPRQGIVLDGPHNDVASVPTPYDNSKLYIIGIAEPYAMYIVGSDGELHSIGSLSIDLSKYVTIDTVQTISGDKSFTGQLKSANGLDSSNAQIINVGDPINFGDAVNKKYVDSLPTLQRPFISAYNGSTTFILPMIAKFITQVMVLDGDDNFYYLQEADYTFTDGTDSITINNPVLTNTMRVKILYVG